MQTELFSETAKSQKKKDAAIIGAGAGIGTAIGAIAGGKGPCWAPLQAGAAALATFWRPGQQLKYPLKR
jgi:hypothetical protein